jgi:hypothetical protein
MHNWVCKTILRGQMQRGNRPVGIDPLQMARRISMYALCSPSRSFAKPVNEPALYHLRQNRIAEQHDGQKR